MNRTLRIGILGTGNIAAQFAAGLASSSRCAIVAVGSRAAATGGAFAQARRIPAVGSYEAIVGSPDVDAIYNALPNSLHHSWTIAALKQGKHVLCEKPIACNLSEAEEMFDVAQRQGRLLVEAFMYRSHPLVSQIQAAISGGRIGSVRMIRSSFCFRVWRMQGNIRFDPGLGGGALMDIGCYCINFSRLIAGAEPTRVMATGRLHASGVDELACGVLDFPNGVVASFTCGMTAQADNTASICGDEGYIEIPVPWKPGPKASWSIAHSTPPRMDQVGGVVAAARPRETFNVDCEKGLYALEADDFAAAVLVGVPPTVSQADSLGNMRVLDELRRQLDVKMR